MDRAETSAERNDASAEASLPSSSPSSPSSPGQTGRLARRRRNRTGSGEALGARTSTGVFALLGITVLASVIAAGTVHVEVLLAVAPFALAAGVMTWFREPNGRVPKPAWVLFALSGYSAFQSLPLPIQLLRSLHPAGAAIWTETFATLGQPLVWASLSLDPGASLVEALKWCCYGCAFVAAACVGRKRDTRWTAGLIFGAAVLTTLVTLGHRLVGAESLFGIYHPIFTSQGLAISPLLNPNNLAGYLNVGAFSGISLLVAKRVPVPRWTLMLGVALVVGLSADTGSRAGFVSLACGGALTLVLLRWRKFEGRSVPTAVFTALALTLAAGAALFIVGANQDVWQALFEESVKKLELFSWTRPLIAKHFWTGVGRGAFETAFPAYRADAGPHLYQFAENFVMQWASEWGVPVALAALGTLAWQLRPSELGAHRSPAALVCAVGALVLLAQNLLDLGLELPSISIALFTLIGGAWGSAARGHAADAELPRVGRRAWILLLVGGACLWVGVVLVGRHTPVADRLALAAEFRAVPEPRGAAREQKLQQLTDYVDAAIRRHPAEPFLPLLRALVARARAQNPIPWLARAIDRDPMAGRPYLVLADVLAERGARTQALGAVRRAVEREYGLLGRGAALASKISRSDVELLLAVPDGAAGAEMLTALAGLAELRPRRAHLLAESAKRDPKFPRPRYLRAEDLIQALDNQTEPCLGQSRDACLDEASQLAQQLGRIDRNDERLMILNARILVARGKGAEALRLLSDGCPIFEEKAYCIYWRVMLAGRLHDLVEVDAAAAAYLSATCEDAAKCAAGASWLGSVLTSWGQNEKALQMYERAAREQGTGEAWLAVAVAAEKLGLVGAASRARARVSRLEGKSAPSVTQELEKDSAQETSGRRIGSH